MDLLVVEGESVVGGQAPVAKAQEKNVCGTCGKTFTRERNLRNHEETHDIDQATPEAVAKRLKRKENLNTRRRDRRVTDSVYREKQQAISRTNRVNKKARMACAVGGADVAASSATEAEKNAEAKMEHFLATIDSMTAEVEKAADEQKAEAEKNAADEKKAEAEKETGPFEVTRGGMWIPTDVVPTLQPPPTAPKIVEVLDEDGAGVGGAGKPVKKTRKKDNPKGALRVTTTALTTANVTSFFKPKYDAPRSKEQRAANPRPSEI
jgi:hypothetical protein